MDYDTMVKEASPKSTVLSNCIKAFFVGGTICAIGQVIHNIVAGLGVSQEHVGTVTAMILVFIAMALTAFGLYSKLGKFAGAGSIVPITGFANAVAAPAIEHKKEGIITGVGAKMFTVAGPVIVYGTIASIVVGLIYYFMR